jgi:hypothetical protein
MWFFIFTQVYVSNILVGELFPLKFRVETFSNRPIQKEALEVIGKKTKFLNRKEAEYAFRK